MKILCDDFAKFLNNCRLFYTGKKIEIIRIFEIEYKNNKIFINDEIIIPFKAIVTKAGGVSISSKYLNFILQRFAEKDKGFLIVHNHDNQCNLSPTDIRTFQAIKKFVKYYRIKPYIFVIYSNTETYFKIILDEEEEEFILQNYNYVL